MLGFSRIFGRSSDERTAESLYRGVVLAARHPAFYTDLGVPDTPDGRFDMLVVHAVLLLRRLHREGQATAALSQSVFDLMFKDMDKNLREMGVGDLGVGKRVKKMAQGFYGRLAAYDQALQSGETLALEAALLRNVYRAVEPGPEQVTQLCSYVRRSATKLEALSLESVLAGPLNMLLAPLMKGAHP